MPCNKDVAIQPLVGTHTINKGTLHSTTRVRCISAHVRNTLDKELEANHSVRSLTKMTLVVSSKVCNSAECYRIIRGATYRHLQSNCIRYNVIQCVVLYL